MTPSDQPTTPPPPAVSTTTRFYSHLLRTSLIATGSALAVSFVTGFRSEIGLLALGCAVGGAFNIAIAIDGRYLNGDAKSAMWELKSGLPAGGPRYEGVYEDPAKTRRENLIGLWFILAVIAADLCVYAAFLRGPDHLAARAIMLFVAPLMLSLIAVRTFCDLHPSAHGRDLAQAIAEGRVS